MPLYMLNTIQKALEQKEATLAILLWSNYKRYQAMPYAESCYDLWVLWFNNSWSAKVAYPTYYNGNQRAVGADLHVVSWSRLYYLQGY